MVSALRLVIVLLALALPLRADANSFADSLATCSGGTNGGNQGGVDQQIVVFNTELACATGSPNDVTFQLDLQITPPQDPLEFTELSLGWNGYAAGADTMQVVLPGSQNQLLNLFVQNQQEYVFDGPAGQFVGQLEIVLDGTLTTMDPNVLSVVFATQLQVSLGIGTHAGASGFAGVASDGQIQTAGAFNPPTSQGVGPDFVTAEWDDETVSIPIVIPAGAHEVEFLAFADAGLFNLDPPDDTLQLIPADLSSLVAQNDTVFTVIADLTQTLRYRILPGAGSSVFANVAVPEPSLGTLVVIGVVIGLAGARRFGKR